MDKTRSNRPTRYQQANKYQQANRRQQGLAVLLTVVALPFLLIMAGLAIDSGRAYSMQAKLFAAVDAAGIAAARAISSGASQTIREANAMAAAQKYFDVNISQALQSSNPSLSTPTFTYDNEGNISISLNASADMPTSFIRLLGFDNWPIGVEAQTIRRPVDISLVIDNSGSLSDVFDVVQQRSKDFLSNFNPEFDRVAVTQYGYGANAVVPFNTVQRSYNSSDVEQKIDAMTYSTSGSNHYTNTAEGFYQGYAEFDSNDSLSANLKVIVIFTDGAPNTFTSNFVVDNNNTYLAAISTTNSEARGLWAPDKMRDRMSYVLQNGTTMSSSNDGDGDDIYKYISISNTDSYQGFSLLGGPRAGNTTYTYSGDSDDKGDFKDVIRHISRDLPEKMAYQAREDGVYVFTLGLGDALLDDMGHGTGEDMLYRMANDPSMQGRAATADEFQVDQKQGLYCFAQNENDLGPCFDKMLDVIIRLTL
ncbi:vWA domain-containing protein [Vibrio sp. B1Z05]|uniref:vWA domain-containing protein n=1 Tax=Vibrio sp. B1Z05 TaxID=2654980 RepID=UPI00128D8F07|nr:vWA domain-containing protein [Vibrio sp. B1Z05]MPW37378.1 VWA domain-containing protein [Vibrio sp. B1Z05]